MNDDAILRSTQRRNLLASIGAAAIGGVAASVVGRATPIQAQGSKGGTLTPSILAFDVNESTLDINHLGPLFRQLFGDEKFVNQWYAQLILYSEAITLAGGPYTPFFTLSQAVLKYMGSIHNVSILPADIDELARLLATMPAPPDVPAGLKQLREPGFRLVTLTNSPPDAQVKQLKAAGIDGAFDRLFSIDRVRRYKPAPMPISLQPRFRSPTVRFALSPFRSFLKPCVERTRVVLPGI